MSDGERSASWLLRGMVVFFATYFVWNSLYYAPYIVDDTFISLRYAYNLVTGQGLVYNPEMRIEGFSNFSWVMLEALLLKLGLPAVSGIKFVGLASGLGAIALTFFLGGRLFAGQSFCRLKQTAAVFLLCLNTSFAIWAQAGLETVFLALLLVAMCLRYEVELARANAFPWSALLFALAWMTRPEVPVYALYFLGRRWIELRRRPFCRADSNWLLAAAGVVIPYESWGLWYYGGLFPATYHAKIGQPGWAGIAGSLGRLLRQPQLERFLFAQGWGFPSMLLAAGVGCVVGRKKFPPALWLVPGCGLIFVLYARVDWMPRHRLFVPVLPFVCLLVAFGLGELLLLARRRRVWVVVWCLICSVFLLDYAHFQSFGGSKRGTQLLSYSGRVKKSRGPGWVLEVPRRFTSRLYPVKGIAQFILEYVPPGEFVCLRDIGFPGYLTMNPIWDLAGLITPTAVRAEDDESAASRAALFAELLAIRPGCFYLHLGSDEDGLSRTIDSWLRTDPVAESRYDEVSRVRKGRGEIVIYLRTDLGEVDREARRRDARERVPDWRGIDTAGAGPTER